MSPSGRRAPLPPKGHRRRKIVDASGLVVRPVGENGEDLGTYDYSDVPGAETLRRELAAAFAKRARAYWDSEASCTTYDKSLRHFLERMATLDHPVEKLSELTVEVWTTWAGAPGGSVRAKHLSVLLREAPSVPAAVAAEMTKRRRFVAAKPKKSLSGSEMKRVRSVAAHTVRRAEQRIRVNLALLEQWKAGELEQHPDARWGEFLDHLARTGDVPRFPDGISPRVWGKQECRRKLGSWSLQTAVMQLFPSVNEKGAAAVLLVCHEAWNGSVLEKLKVPDQWPNADSNEANPAIHRLDTDKARRGRMRHSSSNLVDVGDGSPGEAMQRIIAMTDQARRTLALLGRPNDLLLWSRGARYPGFSNASVGLADAVEAWGRQQLPELDGRLNLRLLRHTAQVLYGRPRHNTERVQDEHYMRRDEQTLDNSRSVVAAGLEDALRYAHAAVKMRMISAESGPASPQQISEQAGMTLDVAKRVANGELDTPVAACEDIDHSPLSGGDLCQVSFLLCFACPNSLATARHIPRIVYLFNSMESMRSTLPATVWKVDWEAHHRRVGDLLDQHTEPAQHLGLLQTLTERDRTLIDRMLERRLDP
ncbi:hypothetical protein ACIQGT_26850 [Streptomyces sp. NPDC093108]|uniref:hypothetical protein n=1 Tax=Streptomyces sp. NPDC093108 TaxID=3366030 RepID=UPI0037F3C351